MVKKKKFLSFFLLSFINLILISCSSLKYLPDRSVSSILNAQPTVQIRGALFSLIPPSELRNPVNPQVYKEYSSELIAASLINEFHESYEEFKGRYPIKDPYEYMKHTLLQMQFWSDDAESIGKRGFLNQHQLALTHGTFAPEIRAQIENCLLGKYLEPNYKFTPGNSINFVRPKYAYLSFDKDNTGDQNNSFSPIYGDVVATFNEDVKYRSTFSPMDTLNNYIDHDDDPTNESVYTFLYRGQRVAKGYDQKTRTSYWEAQIWGALVVEDINYLLVNCGSIKVTETALRALEKFGKPIFLCQESQDHSHYEKGEQIFPIIFSH